MDQWTHPYVTLGEITEYVAAFLELLVLASGLQSSGQPFHWTPGNVYKALGWASHLEKIMADLSAAGEGLESRRALDVALSNLTASAQNFPAGLPRLTAMDLSRARRLLLQALLQAVVPDSDDFDSITDCLNRLHENEGETAVYMKEEVSARNSALRSADSLKNFVESAVGCLISDRKQITCVTPLWQTSLDRDSSNSAVELAEKKFFEAWTRNAMEYVTSFTTVYKIAAANLIFQSSEEEWRTVLDTSRSYSSSTMVGDGVDHDAEIAELCCLQLAFCKCRDLAFRITSFPLKTKFETATNLCHVGLEHSGHIVQECRPKEAVSIETFLAEILKKQVDLWWKLPPVLLAGVCAPRFPMLKTYLQTITKVAQLNGCFCKCPCHMSSKTCHSCQQCSNVLMERLWCFGVHHPQLRTFQTQHVTTACNFLLSQAQKWSVV